jgi:hypothetical protein
VQTEAAPSEIWPAGQGVHDVAPAVLAKVPAGQLLQLVLLGALLKCPAGQAVQATWPSAENVPDGQVMQLARPLPA